MMAVCEFAKDSDNLIIVKQFNIKLLFGFQILKINLVIAQGKIYLYGGQRETSFGISDCSEIIEFDLEN